MFGSFLPSLWSSINHSLLGSRSRHCYAIKWVPVPDKFKKGSGYSYKLTACKDRSGPCDRLDTNSPRKVLKWSPWARHFLQDGTSKRSPAALQVPLFQQYSESCDRHACF